MEPSRGGRPQEGGALKRGELSRGGNPQEGGAMGAQKVCILNNHIEKQKSPEPTSGFKY